ncbi:MAG: hypothetical protein WBL35_00325, partial [Ornithinibacter sp.]
MTLRVEDDFAEFVAARWPDLEAVALVTTLEPRQARDATSAGLARLRADWDEVLEEGAPTLRARREVVARALG